MHYAIRSLEERDLPSYRALRLQALTECPTAFGATPESELALSDAQILGCFGDTGGRAMWGGFDDSGQLFGFLGLYRDQGEKVAHKGHLFAMYVTQQARGQGLARKLLQTAIVHGRSLKLRQLLLSCNARNHNALRLYEQSGFGRYGLEPAALCIAGHFFDEVLMVQELA